MLHTAQLRGAAAVAAADDDADDADASAQRAWVQRAFDEAANLPLLASFFGGAGGSSEDGKRRGGAPLLFAVLRVAGGDAIELSSEPPRGTFHQVWSGWSLF